MTMLVLKMKLKKMILDNRRITVREIAHDVDIYRSAHAKQFLRMF